MTRGLVPKSLLVWNGVNFTALALLAASLLLWCARLGASISQIASDAEAERSAVLMLAVGALGILLVIHTGFAVAATWLLAKSKRKNFVLGVAFWNMGFVPLGTWVGWKTAEFLQGQSSPWKATDNVQ